MVEHTSSVFIKNRQAAAQLKLRPWRLAAWSDSLYSSEARSLVTLENPAHRVIEDFPDCRVRKVRRGGKRNIGVEWQSRCKAIFRDVLSQTLLWLRGNLDERNISEWTTDISPRGKKNHLERYLKSCWSNFKICAQGKMGVRLRRERERMCKKEQWSGRKKWCKALKASLTADSSKLSCTRIHLSPLTPHTHNLLSCLAAYINSNQTERECHN